MEGVPWAFWLAQVCLAIGVEPDQPMADFVGLLEIGVEQPEAAREVAWAYGVYDDPGDAKGTKVTLIATPDEDDDGNPIVVVKCPRCNKIVTERRSMREARLAALGVFKAACDRDETNYYTYAVKGAP